MKKDSKLTLQEEQAVVRASLDDPPKFRPIYDAYHSEVFRFVYSRVADANHTADIVSTVFYKAIMKLSTFTYSGQSIKPWLIKIAYNETMQFFRSQKAVRTVPIEDEALESMAEDTGENTKLSMDMVVPFLDLLGDEELAIVELKYLDKMSYHDIAEVLEISEANARVKLHRTIKKLKEQVKEVYDEK